MPAFLVPIDLSGAELRNAVVQNLGTDPSTPAAGQIWYNSAAGAGVMRYRNSTTTISLVGASDLGALAFLNAVDSSTITDGSIVDGDINASAGIVLSKLATQANLTVLGNNSGSTAVPTALTGAQTMALLSGTATAGFSFNSQVVSGIGTPLLASDAANKGYVDATATGLDIKASVRAASAAITVASPGATIDGVAMVAGDRVLRMAGTELVGDAADGIYIWNGAAVPMTRAPDADVSAEVNAGMFTFVEEGTANGDKGFVLTTNNPITLDTTPLAFTQFSGSGTVTGTSNRITVTGNQIDIAGTYVGQSSITTLGTIGTGVWNGTDIAVADGGTGASTAAGAKSNLGFMTRYATTFGNGVLTSFTITHSLGTNDVTAEIYDTGTNATVYADVVRASTDTLTVSGFVTPPANNGLRIVVIG